MDQPPPYPDYQAPSLQGQTTGRSANGTSQEQRGPQRFLPVIIPKLSYSLIKGAFSSPFARCYAPILQSHGISQETFLTFLDAFNEVFLTSPLLKGAGLAGSVMGYFYGVPPIQFAGQALSAASSLESATVSYSRAKAFISQQTRRYSISGVSKSKSLGPGKCCSEWDIRNRS